MDNQKLEMQKEIVKFLGKVEIDGVYFDEESCSEGDLSESWEFLMQGVERVGRNYHSVTMNIEEGFPGCVIFTYDGDGHIDKIVAHKGSDLMKCVFEALAEYAEWYNKNEEQ